MTSDPARPPRTLADLRREAGLTQEQVGKAMGVKAPQVSRIEARYPDVNFQHVRRYMEALGAHIVFTEWNLGDVWADNVIADPARAATVEGYRADPTRAFSFRRSATAEELPLQGDQSEPGSDDPSRDVDEPDAQSDESNGSQSQQP